MKMVSCFPSPQATGGGGPCLALELDTQGHRLPCQPSLEPTSLTL